LSGIAGHRDHLHGTGFLRHLADTTHANPVSACGGGPDVIGYTRDVGF
jgi:hypothetical protein